MFQELSTARTRPKLKKIKMGVPANQKSYLTMQKLEKEYFNIEIHIDPVARLESFRAIKPNGFSHPLQRVCAVYL